MKGAVFVKLDELHRLRMQLEASGNTDISEYLLRQSSGERNIYQELEMTGRYVDTHPDSGVSRVQLHSHTFWEIIYCRSDCGVEYLVGAERYRVRKGDAVVVPPDVSHRPLFPARMETPYDRYILWISSEFYNVLMRQFPTVPRNLPYLIRPSPDHQKMLRQFFKTGIREAAEKGPDWEMALVGNTMLLLTFLRRIVQDEATAIPPAEEPELMEQIMAYIEDHLKEKITLADTAKHFFVSPGTISRTIRGKMGASFYQCVTQRRLIAAKSLILQGGPLESINEQVGFSDYSTFYRAFKQEYGISPRQFRVLQDTHE